MKLLSLLVLMTVTTTVFAANFSITLAEAGRYQVTIAAAEECTPTRYSIVTAEMGHNARGTKTLKAIVSPIVDTDITTTVCQNGTNVAAGELFVSANTRVTINLAGARGRLDQHQVRVAKVTATRIIR